MSVQPSASKSHILVNCSYAFDPAHEIENDGGSAASRYGSGFHEIIAYLVALGAGVKPASWDAVVDSACATWRIKDRAELAGHVWGSFLYLRNWMAGNNPWGIDWLTKGKLVVEKSYAIDLAFAASPSREIASPSADKHLYEDITASEIPGTLDVMVVGAFPALTLDHKTGHAKDFSSPGEDDQMKTLALIPDVGEAVVAIHHADRIGLPMIYAEEIGPRVLQKHRVALKKAINRIGDGSMRPGEWCGYCPARGICPTQYAQIVPSAVAIVESVGAIVPSASGEISTTVMVGKMHQLRSQMNAMMKKVDDEIYAYVRSHPEEVVERPDGKHLEFITREYESLSKKAFEDALGKVEAEKWFGKLRKLGVLKKAPREELRAVAESGE